MSKKIMSVKLIPTSKIKPYKKNPRINESAVEQVAQSINEYGFKQPIVVDKKMIVIVGHTRLLAAKSLDMKEVPVLIADDLTPKQIKAYRIADNKTAEFAEWDMGLLGLELKGLDNLYTGFEIDDLKINNDREDLSASFSESYFVRVEFDNEADQQELYEELNERGLTCQVLSL